MTAETPEALLAAMQTPTYDDDGNERIDICTCGTCGRSWNDAAVSQWTPTPSARCPFEYEHVYDDDALYEQRLERGRAQWGDKFDPSSLEVASQFIPYFNSDQRVRVRTGGQELTGRIGTTSGWRPSFLLMRRSSDRGSSYLLGAGDVIVAVQYGRRYVPVANLYVRPGVN
jgi:hypothetical protein